ncbi:MAG TPA: V4R domain-containing protein [Candidatus Acidoferrales bacterium]|nr:V4R domain-containing protein [Candidatus Acidoferrales bacterium]
MALLEKLMLARAISFKDGNISLFTNRVVMPPSKMFSELSRKIDGNPEQVYNLYESCKYSFEDVIANDNRTYKFSVNDYIKWIMEVATFTGWGILAWKELDKDKKHSTIVVDNSPVAVDLKTKVKRPVDHVVRGFIAGGMSAAFKTDMDVIELECVALGAPQCKFLSMPASEIRMSPNTVAQLRPK